MALPAVSICMPYWHRAEALHRSLRWYAEHYHGKLRYEVVVADDGCGLLSSSPLVRVVSLPPKEHPLNPCVPINRAVAAAQHDIIVLTNPEIEHHQPVFFEMLLLLQQPNDYVAARCMDESRGWVAGPDVDYTTGGRLPVPAGAHFHFCTMFYRSLWDAAGGFDEDYREGQACDDNDWLWRLKAAGANFKTTEGAVWHADGPKVKWNLPHNRDLFFRKWPEARRAALA